MLDCIKERNRYKLNGNTFAYKALRNKVTNLTEIAKMITYQRKIRSKNYIIWKLLKEFGINGGGKDDGNNFGIKYANDMNDK